MSNPIKNGRPRVDDGFNPENIEGFDIPVAKH